MATRPIIQSKYFHLSRLFRPRNTPQEAQTVRSATSSSPEGASQLPSPATAAPVDSNLSDNECTVCRSADKEDNDTEVALKTPTEVCAHPPQVCIGCLQQVILAAVTSGDFIVGIPCPSYGCPQRMGYHDVQRWAAKEVFDRYDKLLTQDSLRTDGRYVFCVQPGCTAGQEHTGGEDNVIVTCHQCGTKQCFRHQITWHEGLTCDQWDVQQRAITDQHEQKTEEWIQAGTKGCPGPGCGKRIQKSEGCDHLTCKRPGGCGHQFCWECLAPWLPIISGDNSRHYDSCKYYSGLPGKNPAPTSRGLISGPSMNQRPQVARPQVAIPQVARRFPYAMLEHPTDITQEFGEDRATQTRRKNAEAQKLYRERKKQYEAGLLSKVQFQQERINQLEAQLAFERAEKQNQASWPLNQGWLDPVQQLPHIHPVPQTGQYRQHDTHNFGPLDAKFMQSASAVNALFQGTHGHSILTALL